MIDIKPPVTVNNDVQILDANNRVVTTTQIWKSDYQHVRDRLEITEYIARLINEDLTRKGSSDIFEKEMKKKKPKKPY